MESDLIIQNILSPPILFFFLGAFAFAVRSDLEIPAPLPKLFSLYLLLSIGFKGGIELYKEIEVSGLRGPVIPTVGSAILMSLTIPLICFFILRFKFDVYNSAAISAAYGSISAVTFITAESFLQLQSIPYDGFMVAPLALMESPAIIVGLLLVKFGSNSNIQNKRIIRFRSIFRESALNGSVFLLLGSLCIGFLTAAHNPASLIKMNPFTDKLFYGAECFFLLDMGIVASQRLVRLKKLGGFLITFSMIMPIFNAILGVFVAKLLNLPPGNALLFVVLCASASYLAVPSAMRMTIPEAKASYYISTTLGITFPFNIIIGIPVYMTLVNKLIPSTGI